MEVLLIFRHHIMQRNFFHLCDPIRVKEGQGSDQARGS